TGAHRADARALGVEARHARADRHLGAVPRLAGDGRDLHGAVGDLRDLELEELAHQVGVRTAQRDLGALHSTADLDDVGAQTLAVHVLLRRHLLVRRQHGLRAPDVDQDHARVTALLDDTGKDLALLAA